MITDATTRTSAATARNSSEVVAAGGKMGKDEFLKLLVAQLKNQDPMSPSNGQELAAQLAQFSSLEQLTQIGETLGTQGSYFQEMINSLGTTGAQAMLGKPVVALGDHVLVPEDGEASVRFAVGKGGGAATLRLYDAAGKEIASRPLGVLRAGEQEAALGGLAEGLAAGWYTYAVDVVDSSGGTVPTETYVTATVDGIRYLSDGPVLTAGDLSIPYAAVVGVGR